MQNEEPRTLRAFVAARWMCAFFMSNDFPSLAGFQTGTHAGISTPITVHFRDPHAWEDSSLAFALTHHEAALEALRNLFMGAPDWVQLRVWVLLDLTQQGQAFWSREAIEAHFWALRPESLDSVLKRLRECTLLSWDETQRQYGLSPLAQQVVTLLAPLGHAQDDELGGLLGQVVGAQQLGTLDGTQVQMLQGQLSRLHEEFADAIASGSEFRLRQARGRYDRATRLIDKASDAIRALVVHARGQLALEKAARALGQAQSRLMSMASQFNRALQQMERQRVTLGTTGITSTDVKRWLQQQGDLARLLRDALRQSVQLPVVAPHDVLDVAEAELLRERVRALQELPLPPAQAAPVGDLQAVALPQELSDLTALLAEWSEQGAADPQPQTVHAALLADSAPQKAARYAQVAYRAQLMPLLGDAQARDLPGPTGLWARSAWAVCWQARLESVAHPAVSHLSIGQLWPQAMADQMPRSDHLDLDGQTAHPTIRSIPTADPV